MKPYRRYYFYLFMLTAASVLLPACDTTNTRGTLASLDNIDFKVKEEKVNNSLDKAMKGYEDFLKHTPETAMTPEAIRRLADLKIQKDYDEDKLPVKTKASGAESMKPLAGVNNNTIANSASQKTQMDVPQTVLPVIKKHSSPEMDKTGTPIANLNGESEKVFEKRAGKKINLSGKKNKNKLKYPGKDDVDAQTTGAEQAIKLYQGLLKKYPLFKRNDQVLYQLSRAYEEIGQVDTAMRTLKQLVDRYPQSRHIDEAQFRRAEYFFTRKKYLDAEESYQAVLDKGIGSEFYELALYKQGWSYFKQELYERALTDYMKMLDYKVSNGYDLSNIKNKIIKKRIDDTYRVISLSFSYLGGAPAIVDYFKTHGHRDYEASIYSHLGEYYLSKRRYSDAAGSYNAYIKRNPLSKESPYFGIRIIEIYKKGGFPDLVVKAKKEFSTTYSLHANYWTYFDINKNPQILAFLKSNLVDLANYYHALYQNKRFQRQRQENYHEAARWYREFLRSFPRAKQAPVLNDQFAGLLLEQKDYQQAAIEYEHTAYNYPAYTKAADAGYAAVYAYRKYLKQAKQSERNGIKREIIRSSLKFAEHFPRHKHAAVVLVAAVEDMYALEDYQNAIQTGRKIIKLYPHANKELRRSAWMVIAHASFDTANYKDAEKAYHQTILLTAKNDSSMKSLIENLAASVYKQGDQARTLGNHQLAANNFLRVAKVAPTSKIISTAEYDAAAELILLKQWGNVESILTKFRKKFPDNKLQHDITKKLAVVYRDDKKYRLSATEFERIEKENPDNNALRRDALSQAAELYKKSGAEVSALRVYKKLVNYFPYPIEDAIESRHKMAEIYLKDKQHKKYIAQLRKIVETDKNGGKNRTARTKYLAAKAALVLAEPERLAFEKIKLVKPLRKNLRKKQRYMRKAIKNYTKLVDYEVGEVTAAATYYIAEIYYQFSVALNTSERPANLSGDELEQYNMMIEDKADPFEDKAIAVHEKNTELLDIGVYNKWIDKSLAKLAVLMPARYGKTERPGKIITTIQPVVVQKPLTKSSILIDKSNSSPSDTKPRNTATQKNGMSNNGGR